MTKANRSENKTSLFVKLLIGLYIFIFLSTIFLSTIHNLNRANLWILYIALSVFIFVKYGREILSRIRKPIYFNTISIVLLVILVLTFIQGFFSAPNTTDSMVYHLPRIMYWVQNQTVFQNIVRNPHDFMPPFAEYILLHIYLLTGSDRLLFVSQWVGYISIVYISGLIGTILGANKETNDKIVLLVALMPILILQSVSTQTDLLTANLVIISLYIITKELKAKTFNNNILLGSALGLGMLVKPSFAIFALIPIGAFILSNLNKMKKLFYYFIPIVFVFVIIQTPYYAQNIRLFGNILGQNVLVNDNAYTNSVLSLPSTLSNIIKNVFINIPAPIVNAKVDNALNKIHKLTGMDINDERITFQDTKFTVSGIIYPQEDIVANPIQILLIFAVLFIIFGKNLIFSNKNIIKTVYVLTVVSFVIFSAILRWQPFHSRLLIPFYIIGTIVTVLVMSVNKYGKILLTLCLYLSLLLAFVLILLNVSRPYISYGGFTNLIKAYTPRDAFIPEAFYRRPRIKQYFNARWYWYDPYLLVIDLVDGEKSNCTICFDLVDDYEYPLWILMRDKNLDCKIISCQEGNSKTQIVSTTHLLPNDKRYNATCYKTQIDYGYACYSRLKI